jgi:E3 ubiquitin-protein ligase XBAT32/33
MSENLTVCGHELCVKCALDLCSVIKCYDVPGIAGSIPCPLCRSGIASFRKRPAVASEAEEDDGELEPDLNSACSGGSHYKSAGEHTASSSPEKKRSTDSDQGITLPLYSPPAVILS